MKNLTIFCISLSNSHLEKIINLNYIPVGLGTENFSKKWLRDNTGQNISKKNKYYGEYTFHYWLWKNNFIDIEDGNWIGFCTYRRFWSNTTEGIYRRKLKDSILQQVPKEWDNYDSVLVKTLPINNIKLSKMLKHGKRHILKNPFILFNKKDITVKVHFDMCHGYGKLDMAIDLLDNENKNAFRKFVETEKAFNPFNMFICKSQKILGEYYDSLFKWLTNCEDIFGFNMGNNYGAIRIYGFLAERYLSYWFKKNSNVTTWPIHFEDISN